MSTVVGLGAVVASPTAVEATVAATNWPFGETQTSRMIDPSPEVSKSTVSPSASVRTIDDPINDGVRVLSRTRAGWHVLATGADVYAGANPGCLIQVTAALRRAGRPLPALHPIELVDASIRGLDAGALLAGARR